MTIYYGDVVKDIHAYGFVLEDDKRRDDTFIPLTEEQHMALLDEQSEGKEIVCYDGKVFTTNEIGKYYIDNNGKWQINLNYEQEQIKLRTKEFYNTFLATSKGNYKLQPKGYANAQQSIDTINGIVNAVGGLTQQIAQMVIFYPTPDFTKEEECTEAWLVAHQYNAEPMTKEEWADFYIEFSTLYAKNQYKSEVQDDNTTDTAE